MYKKMFFIAITGWQQAVGGLITWILEKLPEQNFYGLSFILKQSFICCVSFINFIIVEVFINCNSSLQHCSHTCYNFGKNLTQNEILVTYSLVLTKINKY